MPERTVAFVDLAGFVALTEAHGAITAADLVERFATLAGAATAAPAQVLKTIGDAVLITAPDPVSGLAATVSVIEACLAEPGFPLARGGIHHGEAETRRDDIFGPAVNLAARLASYAAGPQLLLTDPVLAAARQAGLDPYPLGELSLRNIARPVVTYAVNLCQDGPAFTDPVCRMRADPVLAAGRLRHDGVEYWFCSRECTAAFATEPALYIATAKN